MTDKIKYKFLKYCIATVWIINGLLCKVMNLVPRHQQIVGKILSVDNARVLTLLIGFSEIMMTIWIISGYKSRLNAVFQIMIIMTMNILEFILVPDLLLWGRLNIIFASVLAVVIYYNEFHLNKRVPVLS